MASSSSPRIALIAGLFSFLCHVVSGDPDTTVAQKICDGQQGHSYGGFYWDAQHVMYELTMRTASNGYNYYAQVSSEGYPVYGHGTCDGSLPPEDCTTCLEHAYVDINTDCDWSIGVQMELRNCRIRYEVYPFTE